MIAIATANDSVMIAIATANDSVMIAVVHSSPGYSSH